MWREIKVKNLVKVIFKAKSVGYKLHFEHSHHVNFSQYTEVNSKRTLSKAESKFQSYTSTRYIWVCNEY